MTSSSTNSGVATITVTFDVTRDQDVAAVEVQNRVNQALRRMPAEVRTNGITVQKQSTGFVMAVGVFAEKGEHDSLFLSNYLDVYVRDALKRVPGVSDVIIFGEPQSIDAALVDPDRLAACVITAGDVVGALREQNVQIAAGSIGQAPPSGQMYQVSVRAVGRLREPAEFDSIIVKSGKAALVGLRTSAAPSSARKPTVAVAVPGYRRGWLRRYPAPDRQRPRRRAGGVRRDGTARGAVPPGDVLVHPSTRPTSSRSRSRKS